MTQHYEYSESLFEPGSILASQFFYGRKKNEAMEPLKRLMLAVLADAVRCYQTGFDTRATSRRRAFLQAKQWLFGARADGPFSFENVCYVLDITPDYLRQMLRNWRAGRLGGAGVPVFRRSPGKSACLGKAIAASYR